MHAGITTPSVLARARNVVAFAAFLGALLLAAPAALAVPTLNGQFDLTGEPNRLALGPDGNIWVTLAGSANNNDVARVRPNGAVTEFDVANLDGSVGITAGPDNRLWVTRPNTKVAAFPPASPAGAEEFTIADLADPRGITAGPDDNLWAASGEKAIRIPPANPAGFTAFTALPGGGARGIATGGGLLWIADFAGQRVVSVTTAGAATNYPVDGGPQEVAGGPGTQIAYSNPGTDPQTVGRISSGGAPQTTNTPNADPFGVAFGSDGAYWFAQFATNNLGRLTPNGAYATPIAFPVGSGPRYIAAGPNNTLWVGLETAKKIARITGVDPPPAPPPSPPDGAPQTTITKAPTGRVTTKRRLAKRVRYAFTSSIGGSTFECSLRKKGKRNKREKRLARFQRCTSPKIYKRVRIGRYVFGVRATADGITDPTPARRKLRIVRARR
jgi:streptogramin lyase